jgi:hypothetical protein
MNVGQALSIRTDLINEAYALELQKLQDAVTPFDSTEAKLIICRELKIKDLSEVFSSISDAPIASASIGQVYKGRLKNGQEVAVKVQVLIENDKDGDDDEVLIIIINITFIMLIMKIVDDSSDDDVL